MNKSIYIVNFYICELFISLASTLSSIATPTNSTWRERSVWFDQLVDKTQSTPYFFNNLFTSRLRVDACSEAVCPWISQLDSMLLVLGTEKSEDWPECLMIVSLVSSFDNCHREKWLKNARLLPGHLIRFR